MKITTLMKAESNDKEYKKIKTIKYISKIKCQILRNANKAE